VTTLPVISGHAGTSPSSRARATSASNCWTAAHSTARPGHSSTAPPFGAILRLSRPGRHGAHQPEITRPTRRCLR
jgi:hypothetical protein